MIASVVRVSEFKVGAQLAYKDVRHPAPLSRKAMSAVHRLDPTPAS
jgi:hypothetical protein